MNKRSLAIAAALVIGFALPAGLAKAERLSTSSVGGAAGANASLSVNTTAISIPTSATLNRLPKPPAPPSLPSRPSQPTQPSVPSLPSLPSLPSQP